MSTATPSRCFVFNTSTGRLIVRRTVQAVVRYCPHDYQLEGVCHVLDGSDLIAILLTGAGKTNYYTFYMLMLLAISLNLALGSPVQAHAVPPDPCIVMVYPTNGLEEEQVRMSPCNVTQEEPVPIPLQAATFEKAGIQTLV